jgi:predicted patatin/cPLA2 family phospholipase
MEGGGMRGIFTAGVLDAFLEEGFDHFDLYLGVSAGACNLSSYLAGQHGRNYRIFTVQMRHPEFMSLKKYIRGGHYMDLDWLWEAFQREDPLDYVAAHENTRGKEVVFVCTSVDSGKPVYLMPDREDWLLHLKASSSLPFFYKSFQRVNSELLSDGGIADPIPVIEAFRRGARKIYVIRTKPADFVRFGGGWSSITSFLYRKTPAFREAIKRAVEPYERAVTFIKSPPDGVEIVHIAPPVTMKCGRLTQDLDKLNHDYRLGTEAGRKIVRKPI